MKMENNENLLDHLQKVMKLMIINDERNPFENFE